MVPSRGRTRICRAHHHKLQCALRELPHARDGLNLVLLTGVERPSDDALCGEPPHDPQRRRADGGTNGAFMVLRPSFGSKLGKTHRMPTLLTQMARCAVQDDCAELRSTQTGRTPASACRPVQGGRPTAAPMPTKVGGSLSPTEARIRDSLRRSARLRRKSMPDAS